MSSLRIGLECRPNAQIGLWVFLGFLGAFALVIHLGSDDIAAQSSAWGAATVLAGLAVAFYGDHPFDMFSPKFYVGLVFAVFYGVGAMFPFFSARGGIFSSAIDRVLSYYPEAALVSFLCLIGFLIGYTNGWAIRNGIHSTLQCPKK